MSHTTITTGQQHHSALRVEYQATALDGLDSTEQTILDGALNLIACDAEARGIPVERISIKRRFSPEDETEELVLTIWVGVEPEAALDFWLILADTMAEWISELVQPYKDIASERFAIAVRSAGRFHGALAGGQVRGNSGTMEAQCESLNHNN